MSTNDLVGTIPSSLFNCTSLHLLNLGDNSFSGVFPVAVVSRMPSLRTLIMSYNYFTGQVLFRLFLQTQVTYLCWISARILSQAPFQALSAALL